MGCKALSGQILGHTCEGYYFSSSGYEEFFVFFGPSQCDFLRKGCYVFDELHHIAKYSPMHMLGPP